MDVASQTVPCLAYSSRLDALSGWHGDDFYTDGEPETLDEVDAMILGTLKAKVLPRLGPGASAEGTILRRILKWSTERRSPDARCEACGESGKSPRGQGCKVKPNTLFTCHWSRSAGRVGAIDSFGSDSAPARNRIALYLGPDRFDLQFATKELEQDMQTP